MPPKKRQKISRIIKMQLMAGQATPAAVGSILGPVGIKMMDFCKEYNAATENSRGNIVPVEIIVFEDKTFQIVLKTTPAAQLLLKAAGLEKGSANPAAAKVGKVTQAQLRDIAQVKMADLNANSLDQAAKIIAGTARSMGITVDA